MCVFVFFKQKTAYEVRISDWSSDVCSSDLSAVIGGEAGFDGGQGRDVEMVAGLVEDQQLRRSRGAEDAGEAGAEHLAAAQCPGDPVGGVGAALVVRRPEIGRAHV